MSDTLEVGKRIPEEFLEGNANSPIFCAWLGDRFYIFVNNCKDEQDAIDFKKSEIKLSLSKLEQSIFFIINVVKIGMVVDAPYNVNLTPLDEDTIRNGIDTLYVLFSDETSVIRAIRGIAFVEDTKKKFGEIFLEQYQTGIKDFLEDGLVLDGIYDIFPSPLELLRFRIMDIEWKAPN